MDSFLSVCHCGNAEGRVSANVPSRHKKALPWAEHVTWFLVRAFWLVPSRYMSRMQAHPFSDMVCFSLSPSDINNQTVWLYVSNCLYVIIINRKHAHFTMEKSKKRIVKKEEDSLLSWWRNTGMTWQWQGGFFSFSFLDRKLEEAGGMRRKETQLIGKRTSFFLFCEGLWLK